MKKWSLLIVLVLLVSLVGCADDEFVDPVLSDNVRTVVSGAAQASGELTYGGTFTARFSGSVVDAAVAAARRSGGGGSGGGGSGTVAAQVVAADGSVIGEFPLSPDGTDYAGKVDLPQGDGTDGQKYSLRVVFVNPDGSPIVLTDAVALSLKKSEQITVSLENCIPKESSKTYPADTLIVVTFEELAGGKCRVDIPYLSTSCVVEESNPCVIKQALPAGEVEYTLEQLV